MLASDVTKKSLIFRSRGLSVVGLGISQQENPDVETQREKCKAFESIC